MPPEYKITDLPPHTGEHFFYDYLTEDCLPLMDPEEARRIAPSWFKRAGASNDPPSDDDSSSDGGDDPPQGGGSAAPIGGGAAPVAAPTAVPEFGTIDPLQTGAHALNIT